MFVITGITGQVGGVVARTLLAQGREVRAVVRSADKGAPWAAQGCEVALADMRDVAALGAACADAEAVFVLLPPNFDPAPGFAQTRALIDAVHAALTAARPRKVVCLSTVGAQASQANLLTQLQVMEQVLGTLPMPVAFLRAGWFIENAQWDVEAARATGVIPSFLQPLDKPVPMVATADIGRLAAEMLQQDWLGTRVVELEGPHRVSPNQLAASFARVLGREVRMQAVPRDTWEALFTRQGMQNPTPRMQMLDGFNEGWIEFAAGEAGSRKGVVALDTVVRTLVERSAA
jgi:uncharacterized protein YbjT (DUF2867 family)